MEGNTEDHCDDQSTPISASTKDQEIFVVIFLSYFRRNLENSQHI
jgi:hypothetical protein